MSDPTEWNPCCPECSLRSAKKDAEIERLKAALRQIVQVGIDRGVQDTPQVIAREALGD